MYVKLRYDITSILDIESSLVDGTDINRRSQNLHHLYSGVGLKLGVFRFSGDQNNRDLSGAYVLLSEPEDGHAGNA